MNQKILMILMCVILGFSFVPRVNADVILTPEEETIQIQRNREYAEEVELLFPEEDGSEPIKLWLMAGGAGVVSLLGLLLLIKIKKSNKL